LRVGPNNADSATPLGAGPPLLVTPGSLA